MRSCLAAGRTWLICFTLVVAGSLPAQRPPVFDPRKDYAYDLAGTDARVETVTLTGEGFAWPEGLTAGDTALLELTVESLAARAPALVAERGGLKVRQVFEAGSRGRRFVDLSPLLAAATGPVTLTGTDLAWRTGPSPLYVYANPPLDRQRVLVLAPHPDDAEIAAFGVYRRTQADVITVTAGDAGGENFRVLFPERAEHYRIKGWIRTWDSISVPFYGGVLPGRARNLGFYDATLRRLHAAPATVLGPLLAKLDDPAFYRRLNVDGELRDRPFVGSWQGLVDDLAWELNRVRPTVVVAPHPLLDAHADHQYTTIALIEALARWEGPCELYLYTNHGMENEAFPLGDRDAMSGLPAWSGGGLYFRRLYSHPLSPEEQKLKLVALEGMHDLREFDLRDGSVRPAPAPADPGADHDYYRRAPRPNELFFVATREDAVRLRDAFLERRIPRN